LCGVCGVGFWQVVQAKIKHDDVPMHRKVGAHGRPKPAAVFQIEQPVERIVRAAAAHPRCVLHLARGRKKLGHTRGVLLGDRVSNDQAVGQGGGGCQRWSGRAAVFGTGKHAPVGFVVFVHAARGIQGAGTLPERGVGGGAGFQLWGEEGGGRGGGGEGGDADGEGEGQAGEGIHRNPEVII
jgi:hypothetical protein